MPNKKPIPGGTAKDQRQYEHIKAAEVKAGKPLAEAKSIAAAVTHKTMDKRKK